MGGLREERSEKDIRRQSDHLMNLGLDREVTDVSRSVDGDLAYAVFK